MHFNVKTERCRRGINPPPILDSLLNGFDNRGIGASYRFFYRDELPGFGISANFDSFSSHCNPPSFPGCHYPCLSFGASSDKSSSESVRSLLEQAVRYPIPDLRKATGVPQPLRPFLLS